MFQLASLLNGDSKMDPAGVIRSIPVVDYNSLENWQFKSYGEALNGGYSQYGRYVDRHYALMQRENDPYMVSQRLGMVSWQNSLARV